MRSFSVAGWPTGGGVVRRGPTATTRATRKLVAPVGHTYSTVGGSARTTPVVLNYLRITTRQVASRTGTEASENPREAQQRGARTVTSSGWLLQYK